MLANDPLDRVAAKPISAIAHEQWLSIGAATFLEPTRRPSDQSFLSGVDRSFRPLPMHRT